MAQKAVEIILLRAARELPRDADLPRRPRRAPRLLQRAGRAAARAPLRRDRRDAGRRVVDDLRCRPTRTGSPLPPEELPLAIALAEQRPAHGRSWIRASTASRRIAVTALPARRAGRPQARRGRDLLGRPAVREDHALGHARLAWPTPGHETVRYGGNTSCVEVRAADGTCIVLDAGTGHPPPRRRARAPTSRASTCCSPTSTWTTSRGSASSTPLSPTRTSRCTSGARARRRRRCGSGSRATCRRRCSPSA